LYRKIAKLCHPDAVEEQHKAEANKVFDKAKKAFDAQDLQKLKDILKDLENGIAFTLDIENTDEIDKLQALFEKLSKNNENLTQNLQTLHQSPHYQKITQYENNWETYFEEIKQGIEKEIQDLSKNP
jgi:DnaJ-class molecular chaperone